MKKITKMYQKMYQKILILLLILLNITRTKCIYLSGCNTDESDFSTKIPICMSVQLEIFDKSQKTEFFIFFYKPIFANNELLDMIFERCDRRESKKMEKYIKCDLNYKRTDDKSNFSCDANDWCVEKWTYEQIG